MWKSVCSPALQLMPSTGDPVAAVAVLASGGALGTGTASGPSGPAGGAGCSSRGCSAARIPLAWGTSRR